MNNSLTINMTGNPSLLKDICNKLDPEYQFPIDPFTNSRFGDSPGYCDTAVNLEISLLSGNNKLKIVGTSSKCSSVNTPTLNSCKVSTCESPGFEKEYWYYDCQKNGINLTGSGTDSCLTNLIDELRIKFKLTYEDLYEHKSNYNVLYINKDKYNSLDENVKLSLQVYCEAYTEACKDY